MDDDTPPCKRCAERGLECSPNKSIQDIVVEQARYDIYIYTPASIYTGLQALIYALLQVEFSDEPLFLAPSNGPK